MYNVNSLSYEFLFYVEWDIGFENEKKEKGSSSPGLKLFISSIQVNFNIHN